MPGHAGLIAATTDGGQSWSLLRVPTSDLLDVAFPTPSIGYAVNQGGTRLQDGRRRGRVVVPQLGRRSPVGPPCAEREHASFSSGRRGCAARPTAAGASPRSAGIGGPRAAGTNAVVRRRLSAFPLFAGAQRAGSAIFAWGDEAIESVDGGAPWALLPAPARGRDRRSAVVPERRAPATSSRANGCSSRAIADGPGRRSPRSAPKPSVARRTSPSARSHRVRARSLGRVPERAAAHLRRGPHVGSGGAAAARERGRSGGRRRLCRERRRRRRFAGTLLDHLRRAQPVTVEGDALDRRQAHAHPARSCAARTAR